VSNASEQQLHVLHVTPGLGPGGMELAMARVICGLTAGGGSRHSVCCLKGEPLVADRFPPSTEVHCMHAGSTDPLLPLHLRALIDRLRPTVIHSRNWSVVSDECQVTARQRRRGYVCSQ